MSTVAKIVPRILELLKEQGLGEVRVILGGIIPDDDCQEMKRLGVAAIFRPGASLRSIIDFIRAHRT